MTNEEARDKLCDLLTTDRYVMSEHYDAVVKAVEALENAPKVDNNGLLEVRVDSVEELDKVNEVLVRVKGGAWGKFFAEEDCEDD